MAELHALCIAHLIRGAYVGGAASALDIVLPRASYYVWLSFQRTSEIGQECAYVTSYLLSNSLQIFWPGSTMGSRSIMGSRSVTR